MFYQSKNNLSYGLKKNKKSDEMIVIATIPHTLKRFDSRLVIVKGNRLEKRYLSEWRKLFRIDREIKKEGESNFILSWMMIGINMAKII